MQDWFSFLYNQDFMPHGHCYFWQPKILWMHVASDIIIAVAYYAIPIILGIFLYKRKTSMPFPELIALFVAFIFMCGTTHLFAIVVTWYPAYELQGYIKSITALISIATAIVLAPKLPVLLEMPDIQRAFKKNKIALAEMEIEKNEMQREKNEMQTIFDIAIDRESRIIELKEEVNALLMSRNDAPRYKLSDEK